jgi:hypothetical protein
MYRWILGSILAAIVCLIVLLTRGSTKTSYVNGLPPYTDLPGREYIFERDCYIFTFKDSPSDWPYVGSRLTVPSLPADVEAKYVGTTVSNIQILDTVAVGTRFKVASVRRDQKGEKATITYEILIGDEGSRKYYRVDAFWMLDDTAERPGIAPKVLIDYAVPRRSE